jgi:serine/threonine-protein kinase
MWVWSRLAARRVHASSSLLVSATETEFVPDLPQFGRFRATAELGAGAMGAVYRARDEVLGREVAIKTLHARNDESLRERFFHEARAISVLAHPNVVGIFDMGTREGAPYLVMELASGGSLKQRLATGAMPLDEVRSLGIQIAHALAAAHGKQILHRDVKPANILLGPTKTWKLADFGIARLPDSQLTSAGQFLGSPSYAAPESLLRSEFSPASDVYGLGVTLYEALTGALPHGELDFATMQRRGEVDAARPSVRIAIPGSIDAAIARALSRDPSSRPTAAELARLLAEEPDAPHVAPPPIAAGPERLTRLQRYALAGVAVIAVVGIVAAIASGGGAKHAAAVPQATEQPAPQPAAASDEPAGDPEQPADPAEQTDDVEDERTPYDERPRGKYNKRKKRRW